MKEDISTLRKQHILTLQRQLGGRLAAVQFELRGLLAAQAGMAVPPRHAILKRMDANDEQFMRQALAEARRAAQAGEVPVGAVVVLDGKVLASAANRTITDGDPTAHAEMVALRAAAKTLGNHRLTGATLCVTLEPCAMCAGALVHARVARLVYGCDDPKVGAVNWCLRVLEHPMLNHRVEVTSGVLAEESAALLREFFEMRR